MSEIKSSYEKAMERFENIEPDRNALLKKQSIDSGRALCAKKLHGESNNISDALNAKQGKERQWLIEGLKLALLAQIVLPANEEAIAQIDVIRDIAKEISSQPDAINQLLEQYESLCQQYLTTKKELTEQLQEQYTQMTQRHSPHQAASVEANFMKTFQQQIKGLDEQFIPAVQQVKISLTTLCELQ